MAVNLIFNIVDTNGLVDFMQKFPLPLKESCLQTDSTKQSSCRRVLLSLQNYFLSNLWVERQITRLTDGAFFVKMVNVKISNICKSLSLQTSSWNFCRLWKCISGCKSTLPFGLGRFFWTINAVSPGEGCIIIHSTQWKSAFPMRSSTVRSPSCVIIKTQKPLPSREKWNFNFHFSDTPNHIQRAHY